MKIKLITLDNNLNEVENYIDFTSNLPESITESQSNSCIEKTISSLDLPDGVKISLGGSKILLRRHRLYAKVCYPSDLEKSLKDSVNDCFEIGVKAAVAAAGLTLITPASLSAAVSIALKSFETAFIACMGDKLSDSITFDVIYDNFRV